MRKLTWKPWSLALTAALVVAAQAVYAERFDPPGLVLTWQQDPTTTMTIDWQTQGDVGVTTLEYRELDTEDWTSEPGSSHPFPYSERMVHRVELTGLDPATTYEFRFGEDSRVFRFRTMPADLTEPVRFAAGGDVRHQQAWMEEVNTVAMEYDPDFILWGGDLAYADGREDRAYRWYEFFEAMKNTLIDEDGRVVPVLAGIGNHEVRAGYYHRDDRRPDDEAYENTDAWREKVSPYYYAFFAFPGHPGYGVMDFGDYLSVILLDTNHNNPIEGDQTEWLEGVLAERQNVPHVFPVYHVPGYPSHRSYEGSGSVEVREHWAPLFEQYGVRVSFENHDHTYKRTYPIRGESIAQDGVVYLGDGCWGVGERDVHDPDETWYLRRAESRRHVIIGTIQGTHQHFLVVDREGDILDEYPATPRR